MHRVVRTLPEVEGSSVKKVKEITDSAPNSHMLLTKVLAPPNPLFWAFNADHILASRATIIRQTTPSS